MRATLWQGNSEASAIGREILRGLFKLADIDFEVVDTRDALLAGGGHADAPIHRHPHPRD